MLTYMREVHIHNEFCDDGPTHAIITINNETLSWIRKARKVVKGLEATRIERYDYSPDLKWSGVDEPTEKELTEWDGSADYMLIRVSDIDVTWEGNLKYTDTIFDIESIPLKEINENLRVLKCKKTLLPLMLHDLKYETSQAILNNRLKGEIHAQKE